MTGLTQKDLEVVEALTRFGVLLPKQILMWFGRSTHVGSQNDINIRLNRLMKLGILRRERGAVNNGAERQPYCWMLKGHSQSLQTLRHTVLANEVLIKLIRQTQADTFHTERELVGSRVRPAFDGWLALGELGIAIELDTGSQDSPTVVREKIARLASFHTSGYQGHFHTPKLVIWFLTTDSDQRRNQLVKWTEQTLDRSSSQVFGFAHADPFTTSAKYLLTAPIWRRAYTDKLISLT